MDLSNVPVGVGVNDRISGVIQNAAGSRVATMIEFWYYEPDTGDAIVVGYDLILDRSGTIAWSGSAVTQLEAIQISQKFVDNDEIPN